MAKKKAVPKVPVATTKRKPPQRVGSPVRLDLRDEDLERLDRVCRARGLSRAAFSRMAVMERIKEYEEKDA